jgi:hypothetical protein
MVSRESLWQDRSGRLHDAAGRFCPDPGGRFSEHLPDGREVGCKRCDCEAVPRLPAAAVRFVLEDPRGLPGFIFDWRNDGGKTVWCAVVAPLTSDYGFVAEVLTLPLEIGRVALKGVRSLLPRGGSGFLLLCPYCKAPSRFLYAWGVFPMLWGCRSCNGLRYASEGRGRNPFGTRPRFPLDPLVLSTPRWLGDKLVEAQELREAKKRACVSESLTPKG